MSTNKWFTVHGNVILYNNISGKNVTLGKKNRIIMNIKHYLLRHWLAYLYDIYNRVNKDMDFIFNLT